MECRITPKVGVVIVAGGKGERMGSATPKQFMILGQAPVLAHTINIFAKSIKKADIVVVLPSQHVDYWKNLASRFNVAEHRVVEGGEQRFHSVKCGIDAMSEDVEIIAVHDGVRPLCSEELINRGVECATFNGTAIPAIEVSDSFRVVGDSEESKIIDRKTLRAIQTPQIFDSAILRRAYRVDYNPQFTDDASVVEAMGEHITLYQGEKSNIKITTVEDLEYARIIVESAR